MANPIKGFLQRNFGIGVDSRFEPSPERLREMLSQDAVVLIDVRSDDEYRSGHIPGAGHIPHTLLDPAKLDIAKDTPIVVYCAAGGRSEYAKGVLQGAGFTNVRNFGGVARWNGPLTEGTER